MNEWYYNENNFNMSESKIMWSTFVFEKKRAKWNFSSFFFPLAHVLAKFKWDYFKKCKY